MHEKKRTFSLILVLLLLMTAMALPGCDSLPFMRKADYRIEGLDNRPLLQGKMDKFLGQRVAMIQKAKSKKAQADQQEYEQRMIQAELAKALQSEGYYDGKVEFQRGKKAWSGTFAIAAGDLYRIDRVSVSPGYGRFMNVLLPLRQGDPLNAALVLRTQTQLYNAIQKDQCFFTLDVKNAVTLNRKTKKAVVAFNITAGPHAKFGALRFEGSDSVRTDYLYEMLPWKRGDCFNRDDIEKYRATLFSTALFSRVDTVMPNAPEADGEVPITFQLKDRAPRSLTAGVNYYTDQGAGITLGWKHRNLLGAGETLETNLTLSQLTQNLTAKFNKPYFMRADQSLSLTGDIDHENTDAYDKLGIDSGIALNRKFTEHVTGSTGVNFSVLRIDDQSTNEKTNFALVSFPQAFTYDARDDALNPTKGIVLETSVAPFIDAFGQSAPFWKTQGTARTYIGITDMSLLALRVKAGSILGPATANIPATERFYSGGGGSVRGFGYQDIGPIKGGQPQGGRSLAEGSAEMRFKITPTIGAVTFLDMGSVGQSIEPEFDHLSFGTGVGLRYFTAFGPLRFDVGVPLNNKQNASGSYQLYISIGQAF